MLESEDISKLKLRKHWELHEIHVLLDVIAELRKDKPTRHALLFSGPTYDLLHTLSPKDPAHAS